MNVQNKLNRRRFSYTQKDIDAFKNHDLVVSKLNWKNAFTSGSNVCKSVQIVKENILLKMSFSLINDYFLLLVSKYT